MSIKKDLDVFKQMAKLMSLFFIMVLILRLLEGNLSLEVMLAPIGFSAAKARALCGYWFVPVYVVSLIYVTLINKCFNSLKNLILILVPVFYIYSFLSGDILEVKILGSKMQIVLFYIWLILLGEKVYQTKNKKIWLVVAFSALVSFVLMNVMKDGFYLQKYKFTLSLPYFLSSMLSIGFVMFFKGKFSNIFIEDIGKKAIYFYISQGMGAYVIYSVAEALNCCWEVKLLICFLINFVVSVFMGYFIYKVDCFLKSARVPFFNYCKQILKRLNQKRTKA